MLLPLRARPGYWPRTFPRTLVKTCVLALGVLLWVLYFYSTNSFSNDRRPPGGSNGDVKRAEGFILRRPTVPLFEGIVEVDGSTAADDSVVVPAPSGGSRQKSAPSEGPKAASAQPEGPSPVRRGGYMILENLLESRLHFGYNQSVTITTHATYELLDNLIYLSRRWQGPISVAVYAPRDDFKTALLYALWLRRCHQPVRDYVTFHFVYPAPSSEASGQWAPNPTLRNQPERSSKASPLPSKVSRKFTTSSNSTALQLNLAVQNPTGVPKQFLDSDSASESVPNSSKPLRHVQDGSSGTLKNSPEPAKEFQKSARTLKALQPSSKTSKTLKNLQEDPAPFQEPLPNYEHLARDIIGRRGNSSEAAAPSCNATSFPLPRSYRHRHGLPYPINVCRNVARLNAKTHFVLASDIELYPSADVIAAFLDFSRRTGLVQRPGWEATERSPASSLASFFLRGPAAAAMHPVRRVYVLPIFEVDRSVATVPATKAALVDLYRRKKAVYFHKHVCSFCNIIPRLNRWLVAPAPKGSRNLGVFMSIKRHKPFNRWEPIYIGTNSEPLYDERLTWEGQQDKMTQMYELCLMNYDLAILDNAFLVHRPGIKTKNANEYKLKSPFIAQNNKIYKTIIADLEKKHGTNSWCK